MINPKREANITNYFQRYHLKLNIAEVFKKTRIQTISQVSIMKQDETVAETHFRKSSSSHCNELIHVTD